MADQSTVPSDKEVFLASKNRHARGKSFWVVINGEHPDILEHLVDQDEVEWAGGQQEIGEGGMKHWQGMVILNTRLRDTQVNNLLNKVCSCKWYRWGSLTSSKDIQRMYEYIQKSDTADPDFCYEETAELPAIYGAQKQIQQKETMVEKALNYIMVSETMNAACLRFLEAGGSTKAWTEAKARYNAQVIAKQQEDMRKEMEQATLRPWQQKVYDILQGEVSPRKILVILDPKGNNGKSWFMKYYKLMHPDTTIGLTNGKTGDLAYIVAQKPQVRVIFMNLTRTTHGHVNYQALEAFKDGEFCSTKYAGEEVTGRTPHLVMMTNEPLSWMSCSLDRWNILEIEGHKFNIQNYFLYKKNGGKDGGAVMTVESAYDKPGASYAPNYVPPNDK